MFSFLKQVWGRGVGRMVGGGPRDESHLQRQVGLLLAGELSRHSLSCSGEYKGWVVWNGGARLGWVRGVVELRRAAERGVCRQ